MKFFILFFINIMLLSLSYADIINVPADTSSIQGGIDLANDGDTVLVQPGAFAENIYFTGKNIVVVSLILTMGESSYISETIIDANHNNGKRINVINQKLGYMVRCGDPDAIDSIVPMAYGNLALDLIEQDIHGKLVVLKDGRYGSMPIDVVTATKKLINVKEHYNTERLRPLYRRFQDKPLFIMNGE